MIKVTPFLFLISAVALSARATDEATARLNRAAAVFAELTTASYGIRPEKIDSADRIAVVPGFKKGTAVVGVRFGRGFISCRTDAGWSTPGAIALETGSLGVQLGAEEIDIVILSMDRSRRPKLLSDRFAIGTDAAAAWGIGKAAHDDPNANPLFGQHQGRFCGSRA
jgi:lipid-binding SYLF domain-containing protein